MGPQIKEADWKVFREIRVRALEGFCERILSDVSRLAGEAGRSSHERYLAVFKLIQKQDKLVVDMFDNPRRSLALLQLARMHSEDLLTEVEFASFSPETRDGVRLLLGLAD